MYLKQRRKPSCCKSVSEPQLTAPLKLHCKSWICYELKMVNSLHHWSVHGLSSDLMVSTLYLLQGFRPWPVSFSLQRKVRMSNSEFPCWANGSVHHSPDGQMKFRGECFWGNSFYRRKANENDFLVVRVNPKNKPENYSFPAMLLFTHVYTGS